MKHLSFYMTLMTLTLAVLAAPTRAEDMPPLLDVEVALERAAAVTPEKFPNADDVLVDDYILCIYQPDGTSVEWDDTLMKVLTEKGRRDNQGLSFHFTLPYGTVSVEKLEVIKPDGTVVAVNVEEQSRVMTDRSQMGSNIYNPNSKILQVGIPGVEVGDLVRYVSRREIVKARVPDTWSDYQVLEYTSPIVHYVYEVNAPASLPLRSIALKAPVEGTVTHTEEKQDDRIVYRWTVQDVPRMYAEPDMPALYTVVQRLLISTIPDWKEVSQWYWNLSQPHYEPTPEMRDVVEGLVQDLETRREKVRAIFRWVSQEIRYMGITVEAEAPGYEPHDVSLTFENRHGVCRDKAALLVVMLRLADIPAFPVLIHSGPKKDAEVPNPFFNHAVVAAEAKDGSYILMDPTDESTKELFPAYLSNCSYLVARPGGEGLKVSPITPAEENRMRIATTGRIDAEGNLQAESHLQFEGINDNAYRGFFARNTPEERKRYFQGVVKRIVAGAKIESFQVEPQDMLDTETPLSARVRFSAEDILTRENNTALLPVPSVGSSVGIVNFVLGKAGLEERKFPLVTDIACGVEETIDLEIAPALSDFLSVPRFPRMEDDTLLWSRDLQVQPGRIEGKSRFLLKVVEFRPDEYAALKQTLKNMEFESRKRLILAMDDPTQPDVRVLRNQILYALDDAHNWTETVEVQKRVLTYKGKKEHSELKISYNPIWETVEITTVSVQNADRTHYISEKEINELDAGWAGSAPRYPAGKTLVASFPGVEEGSLITYSYKRIKKNRPFFQAMTSFRGENPIASKSVWLRLPGDVSVRSLYGREGLAPLGDAPIVDRTLPVNGRNIQWNLTQQKAVKTEDSLPPWYSFNPTLMLSGGDWPTYAQALRERIEACAGGQSEAAKKALDITAQAESKAEKLLLLRDFVHQNIRTAGPGLGSLPLSALTPADQTLREGYGNKPDQAILLLSMLRALEIQARCVAVSGGPRIDALLEPWKKCPDDTFFDTLLVEVRLQGETLYLNDTSQYDALGVTKHEDAPALNLQSGRFFRIRALPGLEGRIERERLITLRSDGSVRLTLLSRYYGTHHGDQKQRFTEMPPEERRRFFQEQVAAVSQAARAISPLETRFDRYPGEVTYTVEIPRWAVAEGRFLYGSLPTSIGGIEGLRADERVNPLYWPGKTRERRRVTLELAPGIEDAIILPDDFGWNAPQNAGAITRQAYNWPERTPGASLIMPRYWWISEIRLDPAIVPASVYPDLLATNRQLSHPEMEAFVFERQGAGGQAKTPLQKH